MAQARAAAAGRAILRRTLRTSEEHSGESSAEDTLLEALYREQLRAEKAGESSVAEALSKQVQTLAKPPKPGDVSTFHIRLASSHFHAASGAYLGARRTVRRDCFDDTSSFISATWEDFCDDEKEPWAEWQLESVDAEALASVEEDISAKDCFRLKLVKVSLKHRQACGVFLCGASRTEDAKLHRNNWSSFALARPLWACAESSIWTAEAVPIGDGDHHPDFANYPGCFRLRLVMPNSAAPKLYLESHRSRPGDLRSKDSSYVCIHSEHSACSGHWVFEKRSFTLEDGSETPPPITPPGKIISAAEFFGGVKEESDGGAATSDQEGSMRGRRYYADSLGASTNNDDEDSPEVAPQNTSPFFDRIKSVGRSTIKKAGEIAREVAHEVSQRHSHK